MICLAKYIYIPIAYVEVLMHNNYIHYLYQQHMYNYIICITTTYVQPITYYVEDILFLNITLNKVRYAYDRQVINNIFCPNFTFFGLLLLLNHYSTQRYYIADVNCSMSLLAIRDKNNRFFFILPTHTCLFYNVQKHMKVNNPYSG